LEFGNSGRDALRQHLDVFYGVIVGRDEVEAAKVGVEHDPDPD
jgi:hypothetical protein